MPFLVFTVKKKEYVSLQASPPWELTYHMGSFLPCTIYHYTDTDTHRQTHEWHDHDIYRAEHSSCGNKIQKSFTFLVPTDKGFPAKEQIVILFVWYCWQREKITVSSHMLLSSYKRWRLSTLSTHRPPPLFTGSSHIGWIPSCKENNWNSKYIELVKTALDRGWTDHISLTHDMNLQSSASHGHDVLTCKPGLSWKNAVKRLLLMWC